jgi:AcrR family transcriptional regulator
LNKRRKRAKIIASALRLFSKQGFYKTTMRDIADTLGISEGTLYNHSPSKMSLATAAISHVTGKMAIDLRYINGKSIPATEKIREFVRSYFGFIQKNPEMVEYFFRVYLSNRELFCDEEDCGFSLARDYIDEVERLVSFGIKSGEYKERDFCVSFALIAGILGAMTFLNGEQALSQDLDAYHEEITEALYRGLSG